MQTWFCADVVKSRIELPYPATLALSPAKAPLDMDSFGRGPGWCGPSGTAGYGDI